ncbi:DNA-directed RNA polymerase V subunit 1 isoform X2 [Prosopis cineraria]|uniref:DNA-directed RNA polymerase V subunit 1 isoform X2 n=1 Tax=Prosopis cineraria TaxID=364024 RepID=UPI00240F0669|nr:DNA-directed RNA polymerase V subunit 1 isoform X2 [Prosopis cineraria]
MEEDPSSTILDAEVVGIRFSLATCHEICTASINDSSISHASQLSNPFLGLPLEFGRCESCGTSEAGKCEGHFGYIKLPVPIYHPSHISELKKMLSLLCLNCLKMKTYKNPVASNGLAQKFLAKCCGNPNASQVTIREVKTTDGACYLELKVSKSKMCPGFWGFLEKYGYRYESNNTRALLPYEVMEIIKRIPPETRKKLVGKGYFPQEGYVLKYLPVPPNCLSVPEVSDGMSVLSSDPSMTVLRKMLRKAEIITNSRSGNPNFESHQVEAADLQSIVSQYLQVRGTSKAARDIETHYGVNKELNESTTKAWMEKMRTLFIRKGSGFSSRSVITGESYKKISEIGIPLEVAQRITFEERVNSHNINYLQELVDQNLCLTYREGLSTYSLRESSKGHIYLKPGQIVHRRIMDGDIVFINRPPTTHKHSLQALSVYIHDDHTVKINPLICGPLGADFDGDCIHLFYPQSLAAKAEVLELFSLEKQLLSSHSGNLNLQLTSDSLLSLKMLFKRYFLAKMETHQLAMFISPSLPKPALVKAYSEGPYWTAVQMLQSVLPSSFDCTGDKYLISQSEILRFDFSRDILSTMINEIAASIFFGKGPGEVMRFFNVLQPFLMESLFVEGFSVSLKDFFMYGEAMRSIKRSIGTQDILLKQLRSIYNELVQQQLEKYIQDVKQPIINFILKSGLGDLIDSKSESAIDKLVQQIGFLGMQLSDRGKFYSKTLVEDVASHFNGKYYDRIDYPSAEFGLLKGCFLHGLDPYEEMVHSISTREILVRSSRGLSEPGTLFKNLMAILRDVVICYDGTVRNVCSNSVIQFEYGVKAGDKSQLLFPPGEPVGVLAATAMSNPAYKAVLDASPNSNSSWELMKEILVCKVSFKNEPIDRRVILYLNDCGCGKLYCRENAAYLVKNQLRKVSLKEVADEVVIEYQSQRTCNESPETDAGLVGHIFLNKMMLEEKKINMAEVVQRCQETLKPYYKKKKLGHIFKKTELFFSESSAPCVSFIWRDGDAIDDLEKTVYILAEVICPVLLETIIKGDACISSASIIWVNSDSNMWVHNPSKSPKGELALDIILEKKAVKQNGDAWRIVLDSCLPVLHLIDTTRSIPYAIKQVEELLGISCVFDQVIRRLALSVKMVAKGVLREHLLLLASSMTCGGSLVGFNTGGYKALGKQLKIQIPFTDATLFTPKKCFERAAEKCHTDALSSIVASCSWGKRVAVGTGSRFEVLWDAKEVKSNDIGLDVYNFLHMMRSTAQDEVNNNGCLGEDVDDMFVEDWELSPEHASGTDAVFETYEGGSERPQEDSWSAGKWGEKPNDDDPAARKTNGWSSWTKSKPETGDVGSDRAEDDSWNSSKWTEKPNNDDSVTRKSGGWSSWMKNKPETGGIGSERAEDSGSFGKLTAKPNDDDSTVVKSSGWSSRAKNKPETGNIGCERAEDDSLSFGNWTAKQDDDSTVKSSGWLTGAKNKPETGSKRVNDDSWSSGKQEAKLNDDSTVRKPGGWSSWTENIPEKGDIGSGKADDSWGFGKQTAKSNDDDSTLRKTSGWSSWTNKPEAGDIGSLEKAENDSWNSGKWKAKPSHEDSIAGKSSSWSSGTKNKPETGDIGPPERAEDDSWNSSKWKAKPSHDDSIAGKSGGWSSGTKNKPETVDIGSERVENDSWSSGKWSAKPKDDDSTVTKSSDWSSWSKNKSETRVIGSERAEDDSRSSDKWTAKPNDDDSTVNKSSGWSSWTKSKPEAGDIGSERAKDDSWGKNDGHASLDQDNNCSWGRSKSPSSQGWGGSSRGWDSQNATANDSDRDQWGKQSRELFKKNPSDGSQGWGSHAGERKNRTRPPRTPGANRETNVGGLYTATRQRLDMFTSEEQDILKDIEPIMQNIRRIMQQTGYNDGDPLAADDQTFVIENVFEHHPDKAAKMGAGIDHVMDLSSGRMIGNAEECDGLYYFDESTVSRHSNFQDSRCFYLVLKDGQKQDFSYRKCLDNFLKTKYPELAEEFVGKYFRKRREQQNPAPTNDEKA